MKTRLLVALIAGCLMAVFARADIVPFTYTQTDKTSGSGTISAFTINHSVYGPIDFSATAMPLASVNDPYGASTPAGFVAGLTTAAAVGADTNYAPAKVAYLLWNGSVAATGTSGVDTYTVPIDLLFLPRTQNSGMNAAGSAVAGSDYGWTFLFGDSPSDGVDAAFSSNPRMGVYFGASRVYPDYQRYTQDNKVFAAGTQESYTYTLARGNTNNIRDAGDGTLPAGNPPDAWGMPLSVGLCWRDQGTWTQGAILVNEITFDGYLWVNENAVTLVPEPSIYALAGLGLLVFVLRRRR